VTEQQTSPSKGDPSAGTGAGGDGHPSPPPPPAGRRPSRVTSWLQLLRVPNLFTVPGDPLMGLLLALAGYPLAAVRAPGLQLIVPAGLMPLGGGAGLPMALAATVSLLMYAAGLIWNDWFDLADDLRERPARPLPSRAIRPGTAAVAAIALMLLAVAVAALAGRTTMYVAAALGAAVLAYNAGIKRVPAAGPLLMGVCRGLSVLVGASAFGWAGLRQPAVLAAAGGVTLYIAAVTVLAKGETRPQAVKAKAMLIVASAAGWLSGLIVTVPSMTANSRWALTGLGALAVIYLGTSLGRLGGKAPPAPAAVQRTIGSLIRAVVLVQAAAVVSTSCLGAVVAGGLLVCFLLNAILAKKFYAS
jgi:4-hydroxybenzoate polyprenyltransferase